MYSRGVLTALQQLPDGWRDVIDRALRYAPNPPPDGSTSKQVEAVAANFMYGDNSPLRYLEGLPAMDEKMDKSASVRTSIVISKSWSNIDNHSSTVSRS